MHVTHAIFTKGQLRGGERQLLLLARGLRDAGVSQTIVCRKGCGLADVLSAEPDIGVVLVKQPYLSAFTHPAKGIVHAHDAKAVYWAWFQWRFRRVPYVVTRRVLWPISTGKFTLTAYRGAAHVVAVSDFVAGRLAAQISRPVSTILDAHAEFSADPAGVAVIRERIGGGPILGMVAALEDAIKGQSTLIRMMPQVWKQYPNARLVLIGDGRDRNSLRALAASAPRIIFPGYQSNIADWIAALDVMVHPAFEEALGSTLLDAMHLGVPVVGSTAGGIPEVVADGVRGLTAPPGDESAFATATLKLLADRELRASLITAGREFAGTTTALAMTEKYLKLYRGVEAGGQR
jgi:glycosyltransferase involved in cell wall biosynthesis